MRILEAKEGFRIKRIAELAKQEALLSPCQKSQRGAIVFKGETILSKGHNIPVSGRCDNNCILYCSLLCNHAERTAIQKGLLGGQNLTDASVFHIKVDNGRVKTSNDLSCADCSWFMSGELISRGIRLKEMILYQSQGYVAYDIEEYHQLTLAYLKIK